jgi:hypothetical protein
VSTDRAAQIETLVAAEIEATLSVIVTAVAAETTFPSPPNTAICGP